MGLRSQRAISSAGIAVKKKAVWAAANTCTTSTRRAARASPRANRSGRVTDRTSLTSVSQRSGHGSRGSIACSDACTWGCWLNRSARLRAAIVWPPSMCTGAHSSTETGRPPGAARSADWATGCTARSSIASADVAWRGGRGRPHADKKAACRAREPHWGVARGHQPPRRSAQ